VIDGTAVIVEYTVALHRFHLHDGSSDSPVAGSHIVCGLVKRGYHAPLILFIKRNSCLTVATKAALGTLENLGKIVHERVEKTTSAS
jgi:hypothetical protein